MVFWVVYAAPATVVSVSTLVVAVLLILRRCRRRRRDNFTESDTERGQNFTHGNHRRLHQVTPEHGVGGRKAGGLGFSAFRWDDHPSLVTDAIENGWSRFAFTVFASSPLRTSKALAENFTGDQPGVAIGWEVCEGSSGYMQKIQLNPTGETTMNSSCSAFSVIRTTLPLPGPNIGNAFPQEAYFEITVLSFKKHGGSEHGFSPTKNGELEGDKVNLITLDFNSKIGPETLNLATGKIEDVASVSVGLSGGGPLPIKTPGTYPGSIGFDSSGYVYLGGKLFESPEKSDWKTNGKVVGCGFNPAQRKVFFTVDGRLVHEIFCKAEEFAAPLYPTLAAHAEVTVLVNLGQRNFNYNLANIWRNKNPCAVRTPETSPAIEYEDSRELFSIRRIDSDWWMRRCPAERSNNITVRSWEYDQESDGELFEIPLDGVTAGISPLRASSNYR